MMSTATTARPLTHEETCQLSVEERGALIEQIRVKYPRWNKILEEIERCHRLQRCAAEPPGSFLVGRTGAGKSTLLESLAKRHPPIVDETGRRQPVVLVSNPSTGSIKDLATAILQALGDPRADRGTVGNKTYRIKQYFRDRKVELLIVDELQHFVDRVSLQVLENASNWLKDLIKQTKVACVLAGLEGDAEEVVDNNEQLARMFPDPIHLDPFGWDETKPDGGAEFRTFLMQLEQMLPLKEPSHLADEERAWRCFVASGGVIGYVMALIRRAAHLALETGHEHIDDTLLEQAFTQQLSGERRSIPNPFIGGRPERPKKPAKPKKRAGNVNRRSRPRKQHKEGMKHVLHP